MAEYRDPYKVLGVAPNATDDEIKDVYRMLARKYHPDKYTDSDMKELAEEKMKEINSAYDEIQKLRAGTHYGSNSSYGTGSSTYSQSGYNFGNVRRNISSGNFVAAESELNSVSSADRNAEWHYLMGCVLLKKGYYVDAQRMINMACNMDPSNSEYRAARDHINMQAQGYGSGYDTANAGGCTGCDICSSLLCIDCCCECMGGDLIRCC